MKAELLGKWSTAPELHHRKLTRRYGTKGNALGVSQVMPLPVLGVYSHSLTTTHGLTTKTGASILDCLIFTDCSASLSHFLTLVSSLAERVVRRTPSTVGGRRRIRNACVSERARADISDAYRRRTWRAVEWRADECNRRGLSSCGSREGCENYLYSDFTRWGEGSVRGAVQYRVGYPCTV